MQIAVEAHDLTKNYQNFCAVDRISFTVGRGETFAVLGENGAGKSTTIRMIACRSPFDGGTLKVEGIDASRDSRRIRALMGVVPQENNLDPDLNVLENLLVYSRYFRLTDAVARHRSAELLDFIRLKEKSESRIDSLSGGMKRRLMIARALLHRPKILLLDEPTTGLDPNVRQEIWEKLEELRRAENLTIILSTHYMDEAERLCQRLILMAHGSIVAAGVPKDLILEKVNRFALEIREADDVPPAVSEQNILAQRRGSTHVYFAANPELLTPLMQRYGNRPMILRPSNLEDVFFTLG